MKVIFNIFSLLIIVFAIQGCSGNLMTKSKTGVVPPPASGKATIVFMRSSFVASAIGVELFEINNGELTFVGELPNGSKIAHQTTPGEKVYMAYGTAADFMIAKVIGNKTYYSIVRPNWGTGGFAPTPIRADGSSDYNMNSSEFEDWKSDTDLLEKKPDAREWFKKNKDKYKKIYNEYWSRFQKKTAAEKLERTMQVSDGI
ncbi:hypothetical protein [Pleionea sediminis]|uniref:hypothetical protein n=1 Tax=Pleionea sediminis TaxID=2569479 RepID=UPI00118693A8|nr:hypothetical protein [Pleionea sediminis]